MGVVDRFLPGWVGLGIGTYLTGCLFSRVRWMLTVLSGAIRVMITSMRVPSLLVTCMLITCMLIMCMLVSCMLVLLDTSSWLAMADTIGAGPRPPVSW